VKTESRDRCRLEERVYAGGDAELLGRKESAVLCGTAVRTWDRLVSSGKTPRPIRLGGRPMWRRRVLLQWIEAGCPDRDRWEVISEG
jgi:predicted DNA-binding transcriptional regulator AlpA